METNETEFPLMNERNGDALEVAPFITTPEDIPSSAEEFEHGPDLLWERVSEMENSSAALIERVTANPLDVVTLEQGTTLGLSQEEISNTIVTGGYGEKDVTLREKAQGLYQSFSARLARAAQVGVAALAIAASAPSPAESGVVTPSVTLKMEQTLEGEKKPQTHEEAIARLRESVLAPAETLAVFERKAGGKSFQPIVFEKGASNHVYSDDADSTKIDKAMSSRTSDVEIDHVHPINKGTGEEYLSDEDREILRHGGIPHVAMSPSRTDLMGLVRTGAGFPSAQLTERVIDPSGEWDYGIADSGNPFIRGVHEVAEEMDKEEVVPFTEEERAYVKKMNLEDVNPAILEQTISSRAGNDPIGLSMREKLHALASKEAEMIRKNINPADLAKFATIEGDGSPWVHPGTPSGDAEIARREQVASELGFHLTYKANPAPIENRNIDTERGHMLQMSGTIDSAISPESLTRGIPAVGVTGFQATHVEDSAYLPNKEEGGREQY